MGSEIQRWADAAQYRSTAMPDEARAKGGGVKPVVTLLNATPDPLGSLAALAGIYKGQVVRSLASVTDDERRQAFADISSTELDGPFEAIQLHFLIEGVDRAFTHQAVRSRFSFFAQESLRFAVVDDESWMDRQVYPPSLAREPEKQFHLRDSSFSSPEERDYAMRRDAWDDAIITVQHAYNALVNAGVPAEEARGLMPHSIATRYHWVVSYRTLRNEAGKRLCTQAQFAWRQVMAEISKAIRDYGNRSYVARRVESPVEGVAAGWTDGAPEPWQFALLADGLRPVCYNEGKCTFMASFDRGCKIRERVNQNASAGRPSSEWHLEAPIGSAPGTYRPILPILPHEWLADPGAARVRPGGAQ